MYVEGGLNLDKMEEDFSMKENSYAGFFSVQTNLVSAES